MKKLIYLEDAIDALGDEPEVWSGKDEYEQGLNNQWHYDVNALKALPSAEPERKKGMFIGTEFDGYADGNPAYYEWICSECGCTFEDDEPTYNFCPNCGCEIER